jgi:hypothetical protein
MGRREREGGFPKTDATTILADEQKGVFRVLDIGRPRPAGILLPHFFCMRLKVLWIRIRRIHMFLGLPDPNPDPLVRDTDPNPTLDPDTDPSIIKQK